MRIRAVRTLVKSPPELWELVDDPELMSRWSAALLRLPEPPGVSVTLREAGERVAWHAAAPAGTVAVDLVLAEKGFGTNVSISATADRYPAGDILDELLDELGSPQRRPFTRS